MMKTRSLLKLLGLAAAILTCTLLPAFAPVGAVASDAIIICVPRA